MGRRLRQLVVTCALAGLGLQVPAQADGTLARPEPLPIDSFAEHDAFADVAIAPNGQRVALTTYVSGGKVVAVLDAATRDPVRLIKIPPDFEFNWLRWAGDGRLLVSVSVKTRFDGEEVRVSRLLELDVASGQQWYLGPDQMGIVGDDLLWVAADGSRALLSYQRSIYEWPTVFTIDLADPKDRGRVVERAQEGIWDWYADDAGVVRMGVGITGARAKVIYRSGPDQHYRTVARISEDEADEKMWSISRIRAGTDTALVFDEQDDGRVVLARFDLATRTPGEVLYRNDKWDVDAAQIDAAGTPISVDFTDERDRRVWLDPAMAKLQAQFEKALKEDEVWITSTSRDKSRMLVYAGGESDPGAVYLYDAATRKLDLFGEMRPKLAAQQLAKPKTISYTARDGTAITGFLTLPPGREAKGLPLIVMPHGGPYGIRDKLTYDDDVQVLASRGYAVLQPNYRGSGGYGNAFLDLGAGQIGRKMQDDLDDATDWAVKQGVADAKRVCVVGASYGGYAAIWAVIRNPERYRCAASFAGVTDWKSMLRYDSKFFSPKGSRKWKARVNGADENLDTFSPVRTIATLDRPLLVAQGRIDTNVPYSQYSALKAAAKKTGRTIEWLEFPDEGHGFQKPENRAKWYATLIDFLARNNPPD